MALVSIIVPIYNAEKYLQQCLDSIINQTYTDIEIILVDDGSADNSGVICDQYAALDKRIIVLHNSNHGVSYSRNYGIKNSTGEYILFIDSDDTVEPDYVKTLVQPMLVFNVDLVICNVNELLLGTGKSKNRELKQELKGDFKNDFYALIEFLRVPCLKLYKSDVIKMYSVEFPEDVNYAEDQLFNFQYYRHVKHYKFIDLPLYNYIHQESSLSDLRNRRSKEAFEKYMYKLRNEKAFLEELKIRYRDIIFNDHSVTAITRFSCVNSYYSFKEYVDEVKSMVYPDCKYNKKIKSLFFLFLKHDIIWPIYLALCLRDFVEGLRDE